MSRTASCSCGQLQLAAPQDPIRVSICHCLACQQRTGSIFGVQARFLEEQCAVTGSATCYTRTGDSGGQIDFFFCPTCGATVYWKIRAMPGFLGVAVGAFADPHFPAPTFSIYEDRKHTWAQTPSDCAHMN